MKRKSSGPSVLASWRRLTSAPTSARICADLAPAADVDAVRQGRGHAGERAGAGMIFRRAVEHEEASTLSEPCRTRPAGTGPPGSMRTETDDAERRLVVLADDQQIVRPLAAEEGRGRVLDRDGVAHPGLGRTR